MLEALIALGANVQGFEIVLVLCWEVPEVSTWGRVVGSVCLLCALIEDGIRSPLCMSFGRT